jgi:hypothetical protein
MGDAPDRRSTGGGYSMKSGSHSSTKRAKVASVTKETPITLGCMYKNAFLSGTLSTIANTFEQLLDTKQPGSMILKVSERNYTVKPYEKYAWIGSDSNGATEANKNTIAKFFNSIEVLKNSNLPYSFAVLRSCAKKKSSVWELHGFYDSVEFPVGSDLASISSDLGIPRLRAFIFLVVENPPEPGKLSSNLLLIMFM